MGQRAPKNVDDYLQKLAPEQRGVVEKIRKLILANLPAGYEEAFGWNMLCYQIPLERYPDTYNGHPLGYVALAAQKNHFALYLLSVYSDPKERQKLEEGFAKAGKKMDMGKSCLRFRKLDDLPLAALAELIARTPPERMIAVHEAARNPAAKK